MKTLKALTKVDMFLQHCFSNQSKLTVFTNMNRAKSIFLKVSLYQYLALFC